MRTWTVLFLLSEQGQHGPGSLARVPWAAGTRWLSLSPSRVFITVWMGYTVPAAPHFTPVPLVVNS